MDTSAEAVPAIEGYELLDRIGSGGMGHVYVGRRRGVLCAVKVLKRDLMTHPAVVRRFKKEVQLLMLQNHPGIVALEDAGHTEDGRLYLATELIPGMDLFRVIQRVGPMPPDIWTALATPLLSALAAAHELTDHDGRPVRLIHRDIKPENVMVGYDGRVVILDFGLAQARLSEERSRITRAGQVMGTPKYMAPEQIRSPDEVDQRTDQFAAAVTLYVCGIGRTVGSDLPNGDDALPLPQLWARLMRPHWRPFTELAPDFPGELDGVLARAMATELRDRFPTVTCFRDAVTAVIGPPKPGVLRDFIASTFVSERTAHREWLEARATTLEAEAHRATRADGQRFAFGTNQASSEATSNRPGDGFSVHTSPLLWAAISVVLFMAATLVAITLRASTGIQESGTLPPSARAASARPQAVPVPAGLEISIVPADASGDAWATGLVAAANGPGGLDLPRESIAAIDDSRSPSSPREPELDASGGAASPTSPSSASGESIPPSRQPSISPEPSILSPRALRREQAWARVDRLLGNARLEPSERRRRIFHALLEVAPYDIQSPCSRNALFRTELTRYIELCRPD
ncbi:MAG: serine/threonine-protein kinase [Myxococcota bacterium]